MNQATRWTPTHVDAIAARPYPTAPVIAAADIVPVADGIWVWDAWPVQTIDGAIHRTGDGTELWLALATPRFDNPDDRHDHARIHLFRRSADAWQHVGPAMPDGFSPGSREWSGSAVIDAAERDVTLYFTAAGRRGEAVVSFEQRIFAAEASLTGDAGAVVLTDWRNLHEVVQRDPAFYMPTDASPGRIGKIKGFRDPAFFRDPADGSRYLLFTASDAAARSDHNGVIGIARDIGGEWRTLPPIVTADGVNNELERPHVIHHGGVYYLFWVTQRHVFDPSGPTGPTGLYGMVSDSMAGDWQPINGSGLVFANPDEAPTQAYSWFVFPDLSVTSFVDDWDDATVRRFGGTFAPFLHLHLDGSRASIRDDRHDREHRSMTTAHSVHGWADPDFANCLDAFRANFADEGELGAACAIYRHGKPVLDAWGGIADLRTGTPWTRDTAVPVFSVTKGIAALCVLALVDRGLINLDRPVADYWPEFASEGKDRVTVREALAHRAGVPVIEGPVDRAQLIDPIGMAARLAVETPLFAPGSAHAYHAITIGWITSELTRRVTGQSIGAWLRQHVAGPRSLNIAIGRTDADTSPVATVDVPPEHDTPDIDPHDLMARPISLNGLIVPRISGVAALVNDPDIQRAELAGANAIVDANSLARLYAATLASAEGGPLLSAATIADACTIMSTGDQWGGMPGPTWGAGLMLPGGVQPMLGDGSYGHDGMGGSLAFAHAPSGISFAYIRNRTGRPGVVDPMVYRVIDRLAEALGIQRPQF